MGRECFRRKWDVLVRDGQHGLEDRRVVDGQPDGQVDVRVPLEASVDDACVGRNVVAVTGGGDDGGLDVEVRGVRQLLLERLRTRPGAD